MPVTSKKKVKKRVRLKKQRILVLTHEQLVPPEDPDFDELDPEKVPWKTDWDVIHFLRKVGHEVEVLGVYGELKPVRRVLQEFKPNVTFNLMDEFDGEALFDQNVVSYLELLHQSYTGCNPRGLMLTRDKSLAKKILSFHRIPTPKFHVFPKRRKIKIPTNLQFPQFVKSLTEHASLGISQSSIVHDASKLVERIQFIHESVGTDAITEDYIDGRELYVGILGNQRPVLLPTWELYFKKAPEQVPRIATRRVKWNVTYRKKYGITTDEAKDLAPEMHAQIKKICQRAYRALNMTGYGRVDLRLTPSGKVYILECNPNPDIGLWEDFAQSARAGGYEYEDLLSEVVRLGIAWNPSNATELGLV